jgi:hypothetical protein
MTTDGFLSYERMKDLSDRGQLEMAVRDETDSVHLESATIQQVAPTAEGLHQLLLP